MNVLDLVDGEWMIVRSRPADELMAAYRRCEPVPFSLQRPDGAKQGIGVAQTDVEVWADIIQLTRGQYLGQLLLIVHFRNDFEEGTFVARQHPAYRIRLHEGGGRGDIVEASPDPLEVTVQGGRLFVDGVVIVG